MKLPGQIYNSLTSDEIRMGILGADNLGPAYPAQCTKRGPNSSILPPNLIGMKTVYQRNT